MKPNVLTFFPKDYAYPWQEEFLELVVDAFDNKNLKTIVAEAPVGFGKSAVAICLAKYYFTGHILTPRKALQDQYFEDFTKDVALLKGMSNYPCYPAGSDRAEWYASRDEQLKGKMTYPVAMDTIKKGGTPIFRGLNCASAPCHTDAETAKGCAKSHKCPFDVAIDKVMTKNIVVSNLHSFIANASRMEKKELIIVDECHDMEGIVRDFISKSVTVPYPVIYGRVSDIPESEDIDEWVAFFRQKKFTDNLQSDEEREEYQLMIDKLVEYSPKNFVVSYKENEFCTKTTFTFIPRNLGNAADFFLLKYGERQLMMSGTIYDKETFCRRNGLNPDTTMFIRVPSVFPVQNRPIFMKDQFMTDNSFRHFEENYSRMLDNCRRAFDVYHNVKGLIHAPSYAVAERMAFDLGSRVLFHTPENFTEVFNYFVNESEPNAVLISPICAQGIDLKYDKARFQLIVRVPYPNAADAFVADMLKKNFQAYNYYALLTFGQMLGRVMRAPDDWGHTILLDSRFKKFLASNRSLLPPDVFQCLRTK